jgi:hypothetical protein
MVGGKLPELNAVNFNMKIKAGFFGILFRRLSCRKKRKRNGRICGAFSKSAVACPDLLDGERRAF